MKTIAELRNNKLNVREIATRLNYIKNQTIDFDVFLPSRNKNLQRDFVWSIEQKRELIISILLGRHIPHISYINRANETLEIIDGKQRLSTMIDFINDKFTILIEDNEYLFSELPKEYQKEILHFNIKGYEVIEEVGDTILDDDKINWFKLLNYAGTPQDLKHINNL